MEIEQVSFNGKRLVTKRGSQADIGHGIKRLVVHASACEIHAVAGNQIVIAAQVDGGNSIFVAVASSPSGRACYAEDAPQQAPGHADFSGSNERANLAAGNWNPAYHHHRIDAHVETKLFAQLFQARGIALRFVAKVKIIAFMHFLRAQPAGKNVASKFSRCGHGKIPREGNYQQRVQPGLGQQGFFLRQRRNQPRRHVRTQNAERMRLKRNRHGLAMVQAGTLGNFLQHAQVTAMDTIKISYADNRGSKICRHFLKRAEYPHAISNSSFSPSCASRTCSGRFLFVSRCGRSWEMWVKKARRGLSSSTSLSEFSTVECVGCGRWRRASRKSMSSPRSRSFDSAGISLKSVR